MTLQELSNLIKETLEQHPELADSEVWCFGDDEGNNISPMYQSIVTGFVNKETFRATDDYLTDEDVEDELDTSEISLEEFLDKHKQIVLIG